VHDLYMRDFIRLSSWRFYQRLLMHASCDLAVANIFT